MSEENTSAKRIPDSAATGPGKRLHADSDLAGLAFPVATGRFASLPQILIGM